MNIEFISVGVKNFRSYGNVMTTFEFNNGLDLVVGTNGNGKTTLILHGIIYALYGVGINGENVDSLINDVNKKNMLVELELISNNIKYKIIRGRKPNILEIYINDNENPKHSISMKDDDQFILDTILGGINRSIFLKLFAIQSNNQETSIFRMSTDARRKLFEALFDLTIYSQMKVENDKNISNFKMNIIDLDKSIESNKTNLRILTENIASINNFIKSSENRIIEDTKLLESKKLEIEKFEKETMSEIKSLEQDLSKLEDKMKKINISELESNRTKISKEDRDIINAKSVIETSSNVLSTNIVEIKNLNTKLKDLETKLLKPELITKIESDIKTYTDKINSVKKEISEIDTKFRMEEKFLLDVGECAKDNSAFLECVKKKFGSDKYSKDKWVNDIKPQFEKDILSREQDIKNWNKEINANSLLVNDIANTKANITKIQEKLKDSLVKLREIGGITENITMDNYLSIVDNRIKELDLILEKNSKDLKKVNEDISEYKVLERDISNAKKNIESKMKLNSNNLKTDLTNIENSIKKSNEDISKNRVELKEREKSLKEFEKKIENDSKQMDLLNKDLITKTELAEFLKQEKIKYHIMQKSFPVLRTEFNKILRRMFYGEIKVYIDNKFDITVVRNGIERNFENFSEGEKKRLDLGFIFTIHEFLSQKNQINTNILIMDELLDSALDSVGTEAVTDYLSEMKNGRNIILITHRNENIEYDRKFSVERVGRYSTIKEID